MQSSVTCNSMCSARFNMKEGRPLMVSGRKTMNQICDIYIECSALFKLSQKFLTLPCAVGEFVGVIYAL